MRILVCGLVVGAGLALAAGCGGNRGNKAATGVTRATHGDTSNKATGGEPAASADKLLGVWEAVKGDFQPGSTVAFDKGGKMKLNVLFKDKGMVVEKTYKVDGKSIKMTHMEGGREHTEVRQIQTLNDTTLVWRDPDGNVDEFKRTK